MKHDLYKTGDKYAPQSILDMNGEVVLALCKVCHQGESELEEECPGDPNIPWYEATECENCMQEAEESGIEYEFYVHWVDGQWVCDSCGGAC